MKRFLSTLYGGALLLLLAQPAYAHTAVGGVHMPHELIYVGAFVVVFFGAYIGLLRFLGGHLGRKRDR
jgi:hypothetical protein